MTTFELEQAAQQAAEKRLAAATDMLWSEQSEYLGGDYHLDNTVVEEQFAGPFCGCDTCIVREVIDAAWPHLKQLALMAEQADAPDSNSGPERDAGSTPAEGT